MKMKFLMLCSILLLSLHAFAQDPNTYKGQVNDATTNEPLPGVNIKVQGTNTGTVTDFNGKFSLKAKEGDILVFSYIGYLQQEVTLGNQTALTISFEPNVQEMEEVVVTAFGMERKTKALGYSVTEVSGEDLTTIKEPNMMNSLSGKIAGVQINRSSGGAGGSSRVVIRGNNSLSGSNQPLFIVDGVPIDNTSNSVTSLKNVAIDYGDGIADLNSDDIETISVLKGPAAAALYGTRAAGGVILINTKTGVKREGIGVEINSNVTFDFPMLLWNLQNSYGVGNEGSINDGTPTTVVGTDWNATSSWGPKFGSGVNSYIDFDGETKSYQGYENNVKDFFQNGLTLTNGVALSGGNEISDFRISYTNLQNNGITKGSEFDRNMLTFRGRTKLNKKLSADAKLSYMRVEGYNRPVSGENYVNPIYSLVSMPRSLNVNDLKDHQGNVKYKFNPDPLTLNPYYALDEMPNFDEKDRFLGMASVKYEFTEWLSVQGRTGLDFWSADRTSLNFRGEDLNNEMINVRQQVKEMNSDLMLTAERQLTDDLNGKLILGANLLKQTSTSDLMSGAMAYEGVYTVNNLNQPQHTRTELEKEVVSFFAAANFDYMNVLFLDLTARQDASSALPGRTFFYPSVTGAFAFSELMNMDSKLFTFGKVRASFAKVGNDTQPYATSPNLIFSRQDNIVTVSTQSIRPNPDLVPETTSSFEIGTDLRFFDDRLGLDVTYYKATSEDQIYAAQTSEGYRWINGGVIENKGIEFQLTATPVETTNFRWSMTLNAAKNTNKVLEMKDGLTNTLVNDTATPFQVSVIAEEGQPFGQIKGNGFTYDDAGRIVVDANGVPIAKSEQVLGNITPDMTGGFTNTINYKNFTLNAALGAQFGGDVFSGTNMTMHRNGNHADTEAGRENGIQQNAVTEDGNAYTEAVDAQTYWVGVTNNRIAEPFVTDASFVQLREVSLGYALPASLMSKTPFQNITVSVVGRNLGYLYNAAEGVDPQSMAARNIVGVEYLSLPSSRSLGFNINIKL
ncbi:SusC/RagA family TonB-linked outer membrane protein [Limibacter armeniacum]|uniref:SusC/RagA family TonB-linked outer membrane protein n=1 Tax=Limibacter armeniacum TaxID=466084 RepID=UPI002FE532FB